MNTQEIETLLQRFSRHFTCDFHDAQDLAQITLIKAWLGWKPEMAEWDDAQLKGWLYRTMQNAWIDTKRKLATRQTQELPMYAIAYGSIESDVEARDEIRATLARIGAKQRTLLSYRVAGFSYEEMAMCEQMEVPTMRKRMCYARDAFKREWERVA